MNKIQPTFSRRSMLKGVTAPSTDAITGIAALPNISFAASMTQKQRDAMSPDDVIQLFIAGNKRFKENRMLPHDYLAQKRSSAAEGQFPAAVILSCIDSRAPAEILLDSEIGETFNARIAGNIQNSDIIGSMEFACAVAGAKLILVMGHTGCGAVRGAIDNAELGSLTGLLNKIKPAIAKTEYSGERVGSNSDFVDNVAKTNVKMTVEAIRNESSILNQLEKEGKIKIVGSMYQLHTGAVEFFV